MLIHTRAVRVRDMRAAEVRIPNGGRPLINVHVSNACRPVVGSKKDSNRGARTSLEVRVMEFDSYGAPTCIDGALVESSAGFCKANTIAVSDRSIRMESVGAKSCSGSMEIYLIKDRCDHLLGKHEYFYRKDLGPLDGWLCHLIAKGR